MAKIKQKSKIKPLSKKTTGRSQGEETNLIALLFAVVGILAAVIIMKEAGMGKGQKDNLLAYRQAAAVNLAGSRKTLWSSLEKEWAKGNIENLRSQGCGLMKARVEEINQALGALSVTVGKGSEAGQIKHSSENLKTAGMTAVNEFCTASTLKLTGGVGTLTALKQAWESRETELTTKLTEVQNQIMKFAINSGTLK